MTETRWPQWILGHRRAPVMFVIALFLVPMAHPLLRPAVGVSSHLLWWVHVLPVALLAFWYGRHAALAALASSTSLAAVGEGMFGQGYGIPAGPETVLAVTLALTGTNALVIVSSLYARTVTGRYRILFDEVKMGVMRVGRDGRITRVNPAGVEILGRDGPADLVGVPLDQVVRVPGTTTLRDLTDLGGWTGQVELPSDEGPRTMHAFLAAAEDPETGGAQILISDRSMEVLQEQEFERRSKLAVLGEALAGTAHELNNPLTTIVAHAQLGMEGFLSTEAEVLDSFGVINDQALRMRDLVRELLGFSRTPQGREAQMTLADLLDRLVRVQRVTLGRHVSLILDLKWDGPVGSSAKVEQIVMNLVSNAAHAVRQVGGGTITVGAHSRDGWVDVEVRDDGPGVAPEIQDRLFEPFATTKPEGEGAGLGLAISRRLARTLGGDLTVRSDSPRGVAFVLSLPIRRGDWAQGPSQGIALPSKSKGSGLQGKIQNDSQSKPIQHMRNRSGD